MNAKKILALVLVAIVALSCASCTTIELIIPVGNVPAANTGANTTPTENTTAAPVVENTTAAPVTENTTAAQQTPSTEATTAAPSTEATTAAPSTEATTAAPAPNTGAPQGTAAIVEYYNTAVNKIKTDATTVVRNFEDYQHNEEKLVVPAALQSAGAKLIGTFLKPNNTPETYSGTEAIKAGVSVSGESYVSKLSADDVISAECKDNGTEYEITIVAKTEKNPTYGQGVSAGFEIIKTEDVMDAASFIVKSFETEYYNCTAKCKIDKATGNVTWLNVSTPIIMNVASKIGINAQVGMTFVKDYTITF